MIQGEGLYAKQSGELYYRDKDGNDIKILENPVGYAMYLNTTVTYTLADSAFGGVKIITPWIYANDIPKADPLDVEYDGVTLRDLLEMRECVARERDIGSGGVCSISWRNTDPWTWTPAQRAAVSEHWSSQLRAKIAASRERERNRVVVDLQDEP